MKPRWPWLDSLRGLAVIWMIIFHTAYDMRTFGLVDWNFNEGFWFAFPRVIAFTFLFCVGISLTAAHVPTPNWKALMKRSLKLGGAATVISAVTYVMFPAQWIFFGTLHCIFTGSILGTLVVNHRRTAWFLLVLILVAQYGLGYDIKWVSSILQKPSMDFIPIYPWFWAILLGVVTSPHLSRIGFLNQMRQVKLLSFLGRYSLRIYLLHQPLIFGVLWAWTTLRNP